MAVRFGGGGFQSSPFGSGGRPGTNPITGKPIPGGGGGSGGGSSGGGQAPPETNVSIDGNTVFIDGQGFSVAESKQAEFLQGKGLSGSSYNRALQSAQARAQQIAQEQTQERNKAQAQKLTESRQAFLQKQQQNPNEVFVNQQGVRQGYSVAPSKQQAFNQARNTAYDSRGQGYSVAVSKQQAFQDEVAQAKADAEVQERNTVTDAQGNKFSVAVAKQQAFNQGLLPAVDLSTTPQEQADYNNSINRNVFTTLGEVYSSGNEYIKTKVTEPFIFGPLSKIGVNAKSFGEGIVGSVKSPIVLLESLQGNKKAAGLYQTKEPVSEFLGGFGSGIYQDVRDQPLKNVLILGAGGVVGAGIKGTEFAITGASVKLATVSPAISKALPKVYTTTVNLAGGAAVILYAKDVGTKIYTAGSASEAGAIAGVATKDLFVFGVGMRGGTKAVEKGYDIFATRGRVELPLEDYGLRPITEVLSGKKKFVESSQFGYKGPQSGPQKQSFDIKTFKQAGRGYSATPVKFFDKGFTSAAGSSEFPGLYTAPSPSVYFLKAGGESGKVFGLYTTGGKPAVAVIEGGPSIFTTTGMAIGKGYVPGIKPEIEAVFMEGTAFSKIGGETFFKYKGRRVPVDEFKINSIGKATTSTKDIQKGYSSSLGSSSKANPTNFFLPSYSGSSSSSSIKKVGLSSIGSSGSGSSSKVPTLSYYKPSSGSSSSGKSSAPTSISSSIPSPNYPGSSGSGKSSRSYSYLPRGSRGSSSLGLFSSRRPSPSSSSRGWGIKSKPVKQRGYGSFNVLVRRQGKFTSIGTFGSLSKAEQRGIDFTSKSLGVTYKITGTDLNGLRTPRGYYRKSTNQGPLFIEKIGRRLKRRSTGSLEIPEIQVAKREKLYR